MITHCNNTDSAWQSFLALCLELNSTQELEDLFRLFLTFEERKDLAARYLIVRDLLKGDKTQREMAEDLQVSIAKITRGSNCLKTIDDSLRQFLLEKINDGDEGQA